MSILGGLVYAAVVISAAVAWVESDRIRWWK